MASKGVFIVFEGIDGCGKTEQSLRTVAWLFGKSKKYDEILLTREPTNSLAGQEIRRILKTEKNPITSARKCTELYVADRKQHVREFIAPTLKLGRVVVCDRYKYSTLAIQGTQGIPLRELVAIHRTLPVPDLTVIIDVPVEEALKRVGGRGRLEKFEKKEFMQRLQRNYLLLPKKLKREKIVIVNGVGSKEEVFRRVRKAIEKSRVLPY